MAGLAVTAAALIVAWTGFLYIRLRMPNGFFLLLFKLSAGALALPIALVGVAGAVAGAVTYSVPLLAAGTGMALAAAIPVVRVMRTRAKWSGAFAPGWPERQLGVLLRRPWGWRLPKVPAARVERDRPFWTPHGAGCALLCDLWLPPEGVAPSGLAYIYFHGSAWAILDKDVYTQPIFEQLTARGHVVMDVAYRLYPETDMAGMVGDVRRAVAWMKQNGSRLGVRPDRVVIGGGSAGGHLSLLAAYTEGHPELTPPDVAGIDTSVCGVVSWYGPTDLTACYRWMHLDSLQAREGREPDWSSLKPPADPQQARLHLERRPAAGRLDWMLGGTPEEVPDPFRLFSPNTHAGPGSPPTLLIQGADDLITPLHATEALYKRLREAGVSAGLVVLPQTDHAFDLVLPAYSPSVRVALWHVERFLSQLIG